MEASKVGLLYNQAAPPTLAEAATLLAGTANVVGGLCLLLGGAKAGAGPTLAAALSAAAGGVVGSVCALVRGAAQQGARGPALMQLAGACLEQADALPRVPLDNKTAIGRALTRVRGRGDGCGHVGLRHGLAGHVGLLQNGAASLAAGTADAQ